VRSAHGPRADRGKAGGMAGTASSWRRLPEAAIAMCRAIYRSVAVGRIVQWNRLHTFNGLPEGAGAAGSATKAARMNSVEGRVRGVSSRSLALDTTQTFAIEGVPGRCCASARREKIEAVVKILGGHQVPVVGGLPAGEALESPRHSRVVSQPTWVDWW